ncbi:hypothetical protein ONE63_010378 [Megalurothrips usitatus]|uniref:Uncharacterized protein n=1 Tax=Megalurothrips usitatus TaxID=439358 RepID=A0AAV7XL49_9NEOP|nr:hypothetical protein ONE63_010378 [Megalurothrips usitatus]
MEQVKLHGTFATFAHFNHFCKKWCLVHNCELVVVNCKSIAWGNKRLEQGETPFQEELKYKYLTLRCKHGPTRKTESTGIRPIQITVQKDCPVKVRVNAEQGKPQCFRITKFNVAHQNHPISKANVQFCPERRRLSEQVEMDVHITMMMEGKGKPMAVNDHIRSRTGKTVLSEDIQNMRYVLSFCTRIRLKICVYEVAHKSMFDNFRQKYNIKRKEGRTDTEDALFELEKLVREDPGSKFSIG